MTVTGTITEPAKARWRTNGPHVTVSSEILDLIKFKFLRLPAISFLAGPSRLNDANLND